MFLLEVVIVVILVIVVVNLFRGKGKPDKIATEAGDKATEVVNTVQEKTQTAVSSVGEWFGNLGNMFRRKKSDTPAKFKSWVTDFLNDESELQQWIVSLSDEGIEALAQQVDEFCADLNVELAWLVDGKLENDPELKAAIKKIVISYTAACWQAAQIQDDLRVFKISQALQQMPIKREYRQLSQDLFAELAKKDIVSLQLPDLFALSDKKRAAKVAESIQTAATEQAEQFKATLKDLLSRQETEAAPATEKADDTQTQQTSTATA